VVVVGVWARLPSKEGQRCGDDNDYKRNGTTTLYAALDVGSGFVVIGDC
jgi:hypothetical protein